MIFTYAIDILAILNFELLEGLHGYVLKLGHFRWHDDGRLATTRSQGWLAHEGSDRPEVLGDRSHRLALGDIQGRRLDVLWILLGLLLELERDWSGVDDRSLVHGLARFNPCEIRTFLDCHCGLLTLTLAEEICGRIVLPLTVHCERLRHVFRHQRRLVECDRLDIFVIASEQHFAFLGNYNFTRQFFL